MLGILAGIFILEILISGTAMAQSSIELTSINVSDTLTSRSQQASDTRILSGVIVSQQNELVPGVTVIARFRSGERQTTSNEEGRFRLVVPNEQMTLSFAGKNIAPLERIVNPGEAFENSQIKIEFVVPPIHESVVIVSSTVDPSIERRNDTVYREGLFLRDDQVFHTLDAGINAGQHEGGGKSLEIRRFGYNMDHGGLNGGLKVLVDDVQQNFATNGHGQGYLGQLKSLTPEAASKLFRPTSGYTRLSVAALPVRSSHAST